MITGACGKNFFRFDMIFAVYGENFIYLLQAGEN